MAEVKWRAAWRWFVDIAIGEAVSRLVNFGVTNWQSLAGAFAAFGLSSMIDGATLFWMFMAFLGGGTLVAIWRNQAVQRQILYSPEHKLQIGRAVLVAVEHKPNTYQLGIELYNAGNFPVSTKVDRTYAQLGKSTGNPGKRLNDGAEIAPRQTSVLWMSEYELEERKKPYKGKIHLDIKYGKKDKERYPRIVWSQVGFRIDGSPVVPVNGSQVEPFALS
ncbi:hypothetical protein [Hyphococcus sp.]|uniref:hypothetical protein n=1 Tax=Hyphococcus sp. TaxID=2038636 RepID=UPI003CCBB934